MRIAVTLTWSVAALIAVSTVLTFVYLDRIGALAGVGPSLAQQQAARDDAVVSALFRLVVFGGVWALLGWLLRRGQHAARVGLTVLAVLGLVVGLPGLLRDQPLALLLSSVTQLALQTALLFFLWRPDAHEYLRRRRR